MRRCQMSDINIGLTLAKMHRSYTLIYNAAVYKSDSRNYASTAVHLAMAWSSVARCRSVFLGAKMSVRHFGTSADIDISTGIGLQIK